MLATNPPETSPPAAPLIPRGACRAAQSHPCCGPALPTPHPARHARAQPIAPLDQHSQVTAAPAHDDWFRGPGWWEATDLVGPDEPCCTATPDGGTLGAVSDELPVCLSTPVVYPRDTACKAFPDRMGAALQPVCEEPSSCRLVPVHDGPSTCPPEPICVELPAYPPELAPAEAPPFLPAAALDLALGELTAGLSEEPLALPPVPAYDEPLALFPAPACAELPAYPPEAVCEAPPIFSPDPLCAELQPVYEEAPATSPGPAHAAPARAHPDLAHDAPTPSPARLPAIPPPPPPPRPTRRGHSAGTGGALCSSAGGGTQPTTRCGRAQTSAPRPAPGSSPGLRRPCHSPYKPVATSVAQPADPVRP